MRALALLLSLLVCSWQASAQSYSIGWFRIAGGGGTSAGAPYQVSGTIGQPEAGGPLTAGNYSLTGGYWSQSFTPQAPAPEIAVEQPSGTDLLAGGTKDFGSVAPNSTAELVFTLRNLGSADLTGLGITIDGTDSALFTVTASPSAPLSGPSGSTTFTVRFAPVSSGAKTATLHIASNDADENPFNLILTGTGTLPGMVARDSSRGWRGVASSADGVKLAAVVSNGYIYTSTDSGVNWVERTSLGQKSWFAIASSTDGTKLVGVAETYRIFTSTDSGSTWTQQNGTSSSLKWRSVASSADGSRLIAGAFQDRLYLSTDSGVTWTGRENNRNWSTVASSADGIKLVAAEQGGNLYSSVNGGTNWTARMTDLSRQWYGVASSSDGTKLVACVFGGQLYTSTDSGVNWTARESNRNWQSVASSADGSKLVAAEKNGQIYVSSDYGANWTPIDSARNWYGLASSADGAKLVASEFGGQLYTLGTAPEIAVEQPAGTDLATGGLKDFGLVAVGANADLVFTIRNPGNATLTGLGITIDGADSAMFTVTASPTGPLTGPSGSTTFTVRFAPLTGGLKTATLHIASNDGDEHPYNILLNGTGTAPPPTIVVSISGGMITMSWPDTATGFLVESTPSLLLPLIWSIESGSQQTAGGFISLTIPKTGSQKVFRLRKP